MQNKSIFLNTIVIPTLIFLGLIVQFSCSDTSENSIRKKININREWKFKLGDHPGAEQKDYNDANWQNVGLPHSFSIPYFLSPEFYTGYGWYRKHLFIEGSLGNRRFSLDFEGVFQVAGVYVNGKLIDTHKGGYTGFPVDITKALNRGDNLIAVRVNNMWDPQLAPRAGEHVFSGGIYRDVWLVETAPLHVAWYGTFVSTPEVSEESGKVNIKTEVTNDGNRTSKGILRTVIIDPDGKEVAVVESSFTIESGETAVVDQTSSAINNPKLWSPSTPVLYKALSSIIKDNETIDTYETPFGMRWMTWTADKGFFLNGKHLYFKGANVHQDHAGWGDAVTNAGFVRDIKMMKEAGFDFIRGSHYPHDPAFSGACDSLGMLFSSENCFWGIGGFKPEGDWSCSAYPTLEKDEKGFEKSVKQSLEEMIRIHRNHPSIVAWSMSNEPFFTVPEQMPKVHRFLKELVLLSHKLDPTRAVVIGGCQRGDIDKLGDVAGYNGDGARLFLNPGIASFVNEYGSVVADRPGDYSPGYGDLQEEQFEWRSGQVIWCGFDHGSIAGHFGCMGIVDYFRLPKRAWYWYRNSYNNIAPPDKWPEDGVPAALRLTASKMIIESCNGTDDTQLIVTVLDKDGNPISNSPDVKLEIISGPGEFPTGSSILFQANSDIVIRDGKASVEFRSYYAGETVIRASSPGLKSGEITIISKDNFEYENPNSKTATRPYIRFTNSQAYKKDDEKINLLADRPTKASSSATGHSPRYANDLSTDTYWQTAENEGLPSWWQVDMENIYSLSKITLGLKEKGIPQFIIEISLDGLKWDSIVDQSKNTTSGESITEIPLSDNHGRFLRINFSGMSNGQVPNIVNIEAYGVHVD